MKKLDLTDSKKSDIDYKVNEYPDGQKDIVIDIDTVGWTVQGENILPIAPFVQIKSRLNNFEDLGLIICANKALKNLGVRDVHLYVPYIMGLRSDRLFSEGGVRYIKDILAPLLNLQKFKDITCVDAHSYVAENCIDNLKVITNEELVKFALADIYDNDSNAGDDKAVLVSPDDGASKKIFKLVKELELKNQVLVCSKDRDKEGKITKCIVPLNPTGILTSPKKDYVIIDDICDGGATFINIAKEIKSFRDDVDIYLIVTHGIFSKDFNELSKYFTGIYCTDSYKDLKNWTIEFGDVSSSRQMKFVNEKVKQLSVF